MSHGLMNRTMSRNFNGISKNRIHFLVRFGSILLCALLFPRVAESSNFAFHTLCDGKAQKAVLLYSHCEDQTAATSGRRLWSYALLDRMFNRFETVRYGFIDNQQTQVTLLLRSKASNGTLGFLRRDVPEGCPPQSKDVKEKEILATEMDTVLNMLYKGETFEDIRYIIVPITDITQSLVEQLERRYRIDSNGKPKVICKRAYDLVLDNLIKYNFKKCVFLQYEMEQSRDVLTQEILEKELKKTEQDRNNLLMLDAMEGASLAVMAESASRARRSARPSYAPQRGRSTRQRSGSPYKTVDYVELRRRGLKT